MQSRIVELSYILLLTRGEHKRNLSMALTFPDQTNHVLHFRELRQVLAVLIQVRDSACLSSSPTGRAANGRLAHATAVDREIGQQR